MLGMTKVHCEFSQSKAHEDLMMMMWERTSGSFNLHHHHHDTSVGSMLIKKLCTHTHVRRESLLLIFHISSYSFIQSVLHIFLIIIIMKKKLGVQRLIRVVNNWLAVLKLLHFDFMRSLALYYREWHTKTLSCPVVNSSLVIWQACCLAVL